MFLHKISQISGKNTRNNYIYGYYLNKSIYGFFRKEFGGVLGARYGTNTPQYHEPKSVLFGEDKEPQDWLPIWKYGMGGFMLVATILYIYKPKTGIRTQALEEAKKRVYGEGKNDIDNKK
ncbi:hypothetical protein T552_02476 [Pneumocystis carinii B80]|uniref:NADH dehydrogenase [ubiquinone] 1 beta subcomplex subunit 11, mitochondrial n=1 Tax=Pneumocystis carinii (strain B80) TaxID=1408658 RepID=A0A0W4ZF39_PNEC8|nr:hypothetical protein T552_02476 [Pneumocystis carinii B80]KTW26985.1 hypothetical protein T552_02476 [Pneumocystis carinii B80]